MNALEFCEARIAEDETAARAVTTWGTGAGRDPVFTHIYRHPPDRVLRRCMAERAMLAESPACAPLLAATWSDHPDYNPTWGES